MANANPVKARLTKRARQRQDAGSIEALRVTLWGFITRLKEHIDASPAIDADVLRAGHALIQSGGLFLKAIETGELEGRLSALESDRGDS